VQPAGNYTTTAPATQTARDLHLQAKAHPV